MDDIYQVYVNRVARQTLPDSYKSQMQFIQASPKFQRQSDGSYSAVSFPGYSVVTPTPEDDSSNRELYDRLVSLQQQLSEQLPPEFFIPLPPESFHLTLADLIWDGAFRHASENPNFEMLLHERIAQSFHACESIVQSNIPLYCQVMGLLLMPRALGICLSPKDEYSYSRITELRRSIYQNSGLIALGIEQQYHLTAHITLGYLAAIPTEEDRDRLSDTLSDISVSLLESQIPPMLVQRAELRKFDDMTRYYREENWPVLEFSV